MASMNTSSLSRRLPLKSFHETPSFTNLSWALSLPSWASDIFFVSFVRLPVMVSTLVSMKLLAYSHCCSLSVSTPVWLESVIRSSAYLPASWASWKASPRAAAAAPPMAAMAPSTASTPVANTPPAASAASARASPKPPTPSAASSAASPTSPAASPASSVAPAISSALLPASFSTCSASFRVMLAASVSSPTLCWASASVASPPLVVSIWLAVLFMAAVAPFRAICKSSACLLFSPYFSLAFSSCSRISSTFFACTS